MSNLPPEFERQLEQLRRYQGPLIKLGVLLAVVIGVFILITSCWFTVDTDEQAVVRRFGAYDRTAGPGLHFKLPFALDKVNKVQVTKTWKEEFGFRTEQPGVRTTYSEARLDDESTMVTGDLAVADVEWVTQYRIKEPRKYLFRVRSPTQTFRDLNESVMREVVGDHTVTEVITSGRQSIEQIVYDQLQKDCDNYDLGISVTQVQLQDVNPPAKVQPYFNDVNSAQQERETLINGALRDQNRIIPKARGEAEQIIQEAKGYAVERRNRAQGETSRFNDLFAQYQKAPEVTRQRLYLETMQDVLGKVGNKTIIDSKASNLLPLFNLNSKQ